MFRCNQTSYCVCIVSVTSASHYQSRLYVHPRSDFRELAKVVPIDNNISKWQVKGFMWFPLG